MTTNIEKHNKSKNPGILLLEYPKVFTIDESIESMIRKKIEKIKMDPCPSNNLEI
jgi:hypothetical protein